MRKTLYLVRRPLQEVPPSVFLPSETEGDLLLIERAEISEPPPSGTVFSLTDDRRGSKVSYDQVVTMLFEYERVIVT